MLIMNSFVSIFNPFSIAAAAAAVRFVVGFAAQRRWLVVLA